MKTRFALDSRALCKLNRSNAAVPYDTYNTPDDAYMTGISLGILSTCYAVTHGPAILREAGAINALDLLCTVSGVKELLARGGPREYAL